jgi:hypothetical protein
MQCCKNLKSYIFAYYISRKPKEITRLAEGGTSSSSSSSSSSGATVHDEPWQSLKVSQQLKSFLWDGAIKPTPNPQPGGPGYPFLSGSSSLVCPAWETLPAGTLPPA